MKKLTDESSLSLQQIYMLEIKENKQPISRTARHGFIKTGIVNRTMLVHALSNANDFGISTETLNS